MTDEQITAQPPPATDPYAIAGRPVEPARHSDAPFEVPDIALPNTRRQRPGLPVKLALPIFALAIGFMSCAFGVEVQNRLHFYLHLACFGAFGIALCISVGVSIFRAIEYSRIAAAMRRRQQFERAISDAGSVPNLKSDA